MWPGTTQPADRRLTDALDSGSESLTIGDVDNKRRRRQPGVLNAPASLGRPRHDPVVIGSGEDVPLSAKGRRIFVSALLGIFVVFVALVVLTASGR